MLVLKLSILLCSLAIVSAFRSLGKCTRIQESRLNARNVFDSLSFSTAELFSGPAATYNGELISESLKVVDRTSLAKPAGYVYGAVSNDATPILAVSLVLVLGIAALIPLILSIGESALVQQRERELTNRVGVNEFAIKARSEKEKGKGSGNKWGPKKSGKK